MNFFSFHFFFLSRDTIKDVSVSLVPITNLSSVDSHLESDSKTLTKKAKVEQQQSQQQTSIKTTTNNSSQLVDLNNQSLIKPHMIGVQNSTIITSTMSSGGNTQLIKESSLDSRLIGAPQLLQQQQQLQSGPFSSSVSPTPSLVVSVPLSTAAGMNIQNNNLFNQTSSTIQTEGGLFQQLTQSHNRNQQQPIVSDFFIISYCVR